MLILYHLYFSKSQLSVCGRHLGFPTQQPRPLLFGNKSSISLWRTPHSSLHVELIGWPPGQGGDPTWARQISFIPEWESWSGHPKPENGGELSPLGGFPNSPSICKGAGWTFHKQTADFPRTQYGINISTPALHSIVLFFQLSSFFWILIKH